MKKTLAMLMAAVLCAAAVAGCSGGGGAGNAPSAANTAATTNNAAASGSAAPADTAPKDTAISLKTVSMFGGNDPAADPYSDLIISFQSQTGIKVTDASEASTEDWKASIVLDFNTNNEPDVLFFFNGQDAAPLLEKMVPLDVIRAEYPDYAKDINPSALETMAEADGTVYAVPVKGFFEGIFCNKKLFDEYNVELPTSWEKLEDAITAFRAEGVDPFTISFAEEPHYFIEGLIMSAGGVAEHSFTPGTDPAAVPASWVKGLDAFGTLGALGAFPEDAATKKSGEAQEEFYSGSAAMFFDGSWRTAGIIDRGMGDDVALVPFPKLPGGKGTGTEIVAGFSSGFYITQKAWNDPTKREAAVQFVNHMTGKDGVKKLMAGGAGAPAANIGSSGDVPAVVASGFELGGKASGTDMPVDSRLKKACWTEIWTNVGEIAAGRLTAQELIDRAIPQNVD